jgi:hypothetical protein
VTTPLPVRGPDLQPLQVIYVPVSGKPGWYHTVLIFENKGLGTAYGSVYATITVPDKSEASFSHNSLHWIREIPGTFPPGKYAIYMLDRQAYGDPDWANAWARVSLKCPAEDPGADSLGDIDRTNDINEFENTAMPPGASLEELTEGCIVIHYEE